MTLSQDAGCAATMAVTETTVPWVLEWWQRRKRLAQTAPVAAGLHLGEDQAYWEAYRRLMEVYAVVKAGGVAKQLGVVQGALTSADGSSDSARLPGETANSSLQARLTLLKSISPDEERAVQAFLPNIEQVL